LQPQGRRKCPEEGAHHRPWARQSPREVRMGECGTTWRVDSRNNRRDL
jgi:phage terminase large subunit-like protein